MKIVSVVGARPQFVKAAALSWELRRQNSEILIHTGQHYDHQMSGVFFDGLDLPTPDINLGVGSGSHANQTGEMLKGIEKVLDLERPDWLLVYGDTNSTLAGALAAAKLNIPVAHVEAGLRSFNRTMPEEINRVVADHLSALLFCPSDNAVRNLAAEGINRGVHQVGDVMLDVLKHARQRLRTEPSTMLDRLGLKRKQYLLATVHRSANTDDSVRLSEIIQALESIDEEIVFPVHPRTRKALVQAHNSTRKHIRMIDPVGYLEMIALVEATRLVLTDSGGLQKEAYWLGVPCLTLREETEWLETVDAGWNKLVGCSPQNIISSVRSFNPDTPQPALYGNGSAATKCVRLLENNQPEESTRPRCGVFVGNA